MYVDFLGEYTAGIYGHSNSAISKAITDGLKDGWNFGGSNLYERELAKKVGCSTLQIDISHNSVGGRTLRTIWY